MTACAAVLAGAAMLWAAAWLLSQAWPWLLAAAVVTCIIWLVLRAALNRRDGWFR